MGCFAKATLCAVVGLVLLPIESSAQSQSNNFRQGAPGEYHIYKAPRFEPSQQPTAPRQAAPQNPAPQVPYTNTYGARPSR